MRVLVACESSGVVREAFRKKGHDTWSCDILPSDDNSKRHYQCDVLHVLETEKWDLMIAHPPCTYLCNSGVSWLWHDGKIQGWNVVRETAMIKACNFFKALMNAAIPKIAIENPIQHKYARSLIGRSYDQIIQPYQFGHPERKATCLWLKNLPKLTPTCIVPLPMDKKKAQRLHWLPPSKDRWKIRSKTFEGIAKAFADQWG
jgi:hypothetical protein